MSHFSLMVKVKKERLDRHEDQDPMSRVESAVREMMAPYQENNMCDCPEKYLEFVDQEDEFLEEYRSGTSLRVVMPDGRLLLRFDEEFRVQGSIGLGSSTHEVPDHLEQREFPFKDLYETFEDFVEEWHGKSERDPKIGKYGYWENPDAKWDYWRIGGRWRESLRIRENVSSALVTVPSYEFKPEYNDGKVHQIQPYKADVVAVCDIDFEGMKLEATVKAEEFWEKVERAKGLGQYDLDSEPREDLEGDDRWLRHTLHSTLCDLGIRTRNNPDEEFKEIPFTLEDLKTKYVWYWEFGTFAVLDDNGWHEKGNMGWFGCSTDTAEDREAWGNNFTARFLNNEDQDTTIVICDCHI